MGDGGTYSQTCPEMTTQHESSVEWERISFAVMTRRGLAGGTRGAWSSSWIAREDESVYARNEAAATDACGWMNWPRSALVIRLRLIGLRED